MVYILLDLQVPHSGMNYPIQIIAYYRQTYKAKHYINKSHAYELATKTSKIKIKMKAPWFTFF
jgi:hypothetical protein